jgi:anti-anti-sigma factor
VPKGYGPGSRRGKACRYQSGTLHLHLQGTTIGPGHTAGELDITSAGCLRAWAGQIAGEPVTAVQLDVSGLQFVGIAGLRALVGACKLLKQHCGVAELTGVSPALSRVAELTCTELRGI